MTLGFFSRRLALLAAVSASLVLAACGGGDDNNGGGTTNMRAINLTTDLASIDLYTADNKRFSALAPDVIAPNVSFDANTYALIVRKAGETSQLYNESFSLARDRHYTALVTGREASLLVRTLPEDEDNNSITAGNARLRVFNLTSDTAGVDVFITQPAGEIGDAQPNLRFTTNSLSDFVQFSSGSVQRLRVTSVGNPTDVRLDVPLPALEDRKHVTLVLTSGPGGALVNATLIAQQGNATSLKNTKARVRVAAGADSNGNVAASVGGTTVFGSLRSPSVSAYVNVDAGTRDLTVRINGTIVNTGNRNFVPGADYTLLTYGNAAAGTVQMLADDNRLPNTSTRSKIRLVNGAAGGEALTMQLDFLPLVADIGVGAASSYSTVNSAGSSRLDITSPTSSSSVFTATAASGQVLLQAQGVYTVFVLGGDATATGVLRKDR